MEIGDASFEDTFVFSSAATVTSEWVLGGSNFRAVKTSASGSLAVNPAPDGGQAAVFYNSDDANVYQDLGDVYKNGFLYTVSSSSRQGQAREGHAGEARRVLPPSATSQPPCTPPPLQLSFALARQSSTFYNGAIQVGLRDENDTDIAVATLFFLQVPADTYTVYTVDLEVRDTDMMVGSPIRVGMRTTGSGPSVALDNFMLCR